MVFTILTIVVRMFVGNKIVQSLIQTWIQIKVDCVNISILIEILYHNFTLCYNWEKSDKGLRDLYFFFLEMHVHPQLS